MTEQEQQQTQQQAPQQAPAPAQKSGTGLAPNVAGALCYIFIIGIIFLIIEKDNKFIKFHAIQSILFSVATWVLSILIGGFLFASLFSGLGFLTLLMPVFYLGFFVVWVLLVIKAYGNEEWQLPVIGQIAKNAANK